VISTDAIDAAIQVFSALIELLALMVAAAAGILVWVWFSGLLLRELVQTAVRQIRDRGLRRRA